MLQIPATTIPFPRIQYYKDGGTPKSIQLEQPQWNLRGNQFLRKNKVDMRYFMLLDKRLSKETLCKYKQEFERSMETYKTGSYAPCGEITINPDTAGVDFGLKQALTNNANFVLLVLKEKNVTVNFEFKNQTDRRYGMHSLCITEKPNFKKGRLGNLGPYFGNVMKSNLKAGGTNHSVEGVSNILKNMLVLGADVTHPNKNSLYGTPSIAAVVGSVDELGGKFLGSMRLQPKRDLEEREEKGDSCNKDKSGKNDTELSISFPFSPTPFAHTACRSLRTPTSRTWSRNAS
jgi:eukaryotic translation initiation factor 2C